ncbi:MAG: hypothetical protein Q8760_02395 [Candidatus Phytoplasma australasiaticum]|nr:hypothetical protein [Candidatus Phytoplasma australasiaticum]
MVQKIKPRNFLNKLKLKLSKNEFDIICLSFKIPLNNINKIYQIAYSNSQITKKLNLSLKKSRIYQKFCYPQIKKIYRKEK